MVPTTAAAASELSKPRISSVPAPSSVSVANRACTRPGRIPIDSNHRAVPGSLPPPKAWFQPWASMVAPIDARRITAAMSASITLSAFPVRSSGCSGYGRRPHRGEVLGAESELAEDLLGVLAERGHRVKAPVPAVHLRRGKQAQQRPDR
jgi:hypothetical protein